MCTIDFFRQQRRPNRREFQAGLADRISRPCHMCCFLVFPDGTIPLDSQDPNSVPVHRMVLFVGVLCQSWSFQKAFPKVMLVFTYSHCQRSTSLNNVVHYVVVTMLFTWLETASQSVTVTVTLRLTVSQSVPVSNTLNVNHLCTYWQLTIDLDWQIETAALSVHIWTLHAVQITALTEALSFFFVNMWVRYSATQRAFSTDFMHPLENPPVLIG
jgi:hypothetical protein